MGGGCGGGKQRDGCVNSDPSPLSPPKYDFETCIFRCSNVSTARFVCVVPVVEGEESPTACPGL